MAQKLNPSELLKQNSALNYINYENIRQEKSEFPLSNNWDFTFLTSPQAVYFPGNDFLKARMTEVSPSFPVEIGEVSAVIRGFTVRQAVKSGTTSGTIQITYQDYEDYSISQFIDDWAEKLGDREHRFAYRKEDTSCTCILTLYNTSRVPVREYIMYGCQPNDCTGTINPSLTSDDPSNIGQCTLGITFEHYEKHDLT